MSEVKIFQVKGEIRKPNLRTAFTREVRAIKPEDAVETIYAEIGSRHKAKRFQIKILEIKEIKPEEATTELIRKLA
ncbi:50S ribosomal protein L18a [Candidatus Bathyarchaeota archaeon]|nr:50S ribosomal protein L18a [Candidatus Bathyarchaeota archaeon]